MKNFITLFALTMITLNSNALSLNELKVEDLRNRYLHINPTKEWSEQPNLNTPTSTPTSTPISTPISINVIDELVRVIGRGELSVKQMMDFRGLKDRKNFLEFHLNPVIKEGIVRMKYPDSPRHPRQKYLLTVKGLALYQELTK